MTARVVPILCVISVVAGGALAATITVDTTDPGVAADGWCSLIEAIDNANADAAVHADCVAGAGADVIELGVGQTYALVAAHNPGNGLPEITSEITVNGHGSGIVRDLAAPDFRIVTVQTIGNLTLNDLTLSNGLSTGGGGAIYNRGRLELSQSSITNNEAWQCGGIISYGGAVVLTDSVVGWNTAWASYGGGLCNIALYGDATMTLTRTLVEYNTALGTSGNLGGGGIVTRATSGRTAALTLTRCTVWHNSAPSVPGILQNFFDTYSNAHSTMLIDRCVVSYNQTDSGITVGAGVVALGSPGLQTVAEIRNTVVEHNRAAGGAGVEAWRGVDMTISDSTIRENEALNHGGGVLIGEQSRLQLERSTVCHNTVEGGTDLWAGGIGVVDADAEIINSTVSSNVAAGDAGGLGIHSATAWGGTGSTVNVVGSTIVGNLAGGVGGGITADRADGTGPVTVTLQNSIVAENHEQGGVVLGNCAIDAATATLTTDPFSLTDDGTCPGVAFVSNLMLGPLEAHGEGTPCHAPLPGSPAVDSGNDSTCQSVDQLRQLRPWDGDGDGVAHCDVGSVELYAPFFVDDFEDGTTNAWSLTVP